MLSYDAFAFRQVAHGPIQLAFVATSADIDRWAKVPTKMSRSPNAFQRPAIESHVSDVQSFFQDPSKANSSPTAIILGFEPESAGSIRILESQGGAPLQADKITATPQRCWLEIDFDPWSPIAASDIDTEIGQLFASVEGLYAFTDDDGGRAVPDADSESVDEDPGSDEGVDEDDSLDEDVGADEDDEADDVDESDDDDDKGEVAENDNEGRAAGGRDRRVPPEKVEAQEIKAYFDRLSPRQLVSICTTREFENWSAAKKKFLRDLLKDDRKPGLIIDGQHRVKGTAQHAKVPFLVSFLPHASWAELAFQFIVNNGSSKKVGEGLLISIVGDSLQPAELRTIEERLYRAKIKVSLIQAVMRVQDGDNPFSGMLEFNVPGEQGFLEAPAMQKKVVRLWYGTRDKSGNSGSFAKLKMKERSDLHMKDMFAGSCDGPTQKDRLRDWQEHKWFLYFAAFWRAVANHFKPRLWPAALGDWPRKAKHARPADKERLKLMRVTVLGILQEAVLVAWATDIIKQRKRRTKDPKKDPKMSEFSVSVADFEEAIGGYVTQIPDDFFTEITYTGFDGSNTLRHDLQKQMLELLEGRKEFADIRQSHRFWK